MGVESELVGRRAVFVTLAARMVEMPTLKDFFAKKN